MENDSNWVIPDGISEIVWVGKVSMRGLYSEDPVECFFNCGEYDYSGTTSWRNKYKDIFVNHLGITNDDSRFIIFASEDKSKVITWIAGVRAAMNVLKNFVNTV
jgi:hypothetical protein